MKTTVRIASVLIALFAAASPGPARAVSAPFHTVSGAATSFAGDTVSIDRPFIVTGCCVAFPPLPSILVNGASVLVTCVVLDTVGNEGNVTHILDMATFDPSTFLPGYVVVYDGTPLGNPDQVKVDVAPQNNNCGGDTTSWAYGLIPPVSAGSINIVP